MELTAMGSEALAAFTQSKSNVIPITRNRDRWGSFR